MSGRFDQDLIAQLFSGNRDGIHGGFVGDANIGGLFDEASTLVIDWVCSGDNRSAQIQLEGLPGSKINFPTWIRVETFSRDEGGELKYFASTNDGEPGFKAPSLYVSDTDPGVVQDAIVQYLAKEFAGKDVKVRVFRSERMHSEPIVFATSDDPTFREQPEFPSL